MEWTRGSYRISDNNEELDLYYIVPALQETYWAASRSPEVIEESIANSLCFGLYSERRQIGFARVVTDGTTFAWICDVVVHPEFRGAGLGKWLNDCLMQHPTVASVPQMLLRTRDAHGLYEQFGFRVVEAMVYRQETP
jgi:GNAT superfamily N-acetyltransferase